MSLGTLQKRKKLGPYSKHNRRPITFEGEAPERSFENHNLEDFERFCYALQLPDDRGAFRLSEFMLGPLEDYFGKQQPDPQPGFFENLWIWPTGMAKSTLLGAIALHHVIRVRADANAVILGGLGKHGRHTLNAAAGFIERDAKLSEWLLAQEYYMGRIVSTFDRSLIAVHSAGRRVGSRAGSTEEGEAPTLILVEEYGRHEDDGAATRTLISKVQKRSVAAAPVQIIYVSNAGDSFESALGRIRTRATDVKDGATVTHPREGEYYTRAVDADGDLVLHEYSVPDEIQPPEDKHDKKAIAAYLAEVKKANPAPWITTENLRRTFKALSKELFIFLRQHAGQWVTQDFAVLDKLGWMKTERKGIAIPKGAKGVYVGLDTATKWDRTAIIPAWKDPETGRPRTAGGVLLESPHPGVQRRMRDAIDVLEVMHERWPDMTIVFDRNKGGGLIAEQFEEDHGLTVIDFSQGAPMELASMLLGELIDQRKLEHDENKGLTECILAAVARRSRFGDRWRLEQPRDKRPIDGAVALAMAMYSVINPLKKSGKGFSGGINPEDFRIQQL